MKVNAINSYKFNNVHFEGKKSKQDNRIMNTTTPIKAVPVIVLMAMSPVNAPVMPKAMAAESAQYVTAVAQSQQNVIYQRTYTTKKGFDVTIQALNTKDNTTNFDKIVLKSGKYEFDVKNVYDSRLYINSVNGVKEGPLRFYEVKALNKNDGRMLSFIDQNVAGYVAALIETENNESNIKDVKIKNKDMVFVSNYSNPTLRIDNPRDMAKIPWKSNLGDKDFGTEIKSKRAIVNGSNGRYTVRFYDWDNNFKTPEWVTIQKDGQDEYQVHGVFDVKATLESIDNSVNMGNIKAISLFDGEASHFHNDAIMDDILADTIIKLLKQDGCEENVHIVCTTAQANL